VLYRSDAGLGRGTRLLWPNVCSLFIRRCPHSPPDLCHASTRTRIQGKLIYIHFNIIITTSVLDYRISSGLRTSVTCSCLRITGACSTKGNCPRPWSSCTIPWRRTVSCVSNLHPRETSLTLSTRHTPSCFRCVSSHSPINES
jgi:hypothetical protein